MKFGDGPVSKNKLTILKKSVPLNHQTETKQTPFRLACYLIWISECIEVGQINPFTDSLEYMYLKEQKSLLWALHERGREAKTAYFSSLVSLDLFNALSDNRNYHIDKTAPQLLNLRQICGQLCYGSRPSHSGQTHQKSKNSTTIN